MADRELGPYTVDEIVPFYQVKPVAYNSVFVDPGLRNQVYLLNAPLDLPAKISQEQTYDCINWSLGYRERHIQPVTPDEVVPLYQSYGFRKLERGEDLKTSRIVVFWNDEEPVHVHVKREILLSTGPTTMWTSKLGTLPYLLAYPQPRDLVDYYTTTKYTAFKLG
jgi:hypothetical protein